MRGPIDYIIVGFEGNNFNGSILKALGEAVDSGVIAIVALTFISKDANGDIKHLEITELEEGIATEIQKFSPSENLISNEDIDEMADLLENNTSAGLLVVEQLWAKPLKKAIIDANGVLVAEGRIHPEAAAELN